MKVTIVHTNNKKQLLVSTKTMEKLLQRIAKDDSRLTVTHFREYVTYMESGYEYYKDMPTWMHIYPAAEFAKDENNNLKMKACNGILMLKFGNITDVDGVEGVKRSVAMLPSTFAALEGADGKSVIVLVKFSNEDDLLPAEEADAERLYRIAYQQILPVYQAIAKASVLTDGPKPSIEAGANLSFEPSMHNSFLMTLDAKPYFNSKAVAMKIDSNMHPQNQVFNTEDNQQMIPGSDTSEEEKKVDKESDYIKNYNPIDEYLFQCYDKWDGKDHIRALARTVPTNNPYWADWFYTWFLGMVDQWRGFTHRQYGNSVAPLLISKQGYNKSTFCRRLLPPELQWGYNDNLILSEKRQVYQAMAQFMVINLDEFNQISPQVQQGFLKNLIQLPTLKYKPPYGSHVMEFPRLASFIATSNMKDILTDPSGNRRFIGVELTGPIDVSVRPNYQQLFAQALTALHNGEKSYFDAEQVKLIMKNNSQFEVAEPIDQYFMLYFELVENEREGEYLTAAEIFDYLKKQIGSSLKVNSLMGFGRKLANMSELKHKRFADGMKYLVKKK